MDDTCWACPYVAVASSSEGTCWYVCELARERGQVPDKGTPEWCPLEANNG